MLQTAMLQIQKPMAIFWIVNFIVWTVVLLISAQGAIVAALRPAGRVRRGDPMRLATFLVAFLFLGQCARWLFWPNNAQLWKALYVIGALTGLYVIRLMAAYGRGGHV